jgi:hypothetical protein
MTTNAGMADVMLPLLECRLFELAGGRADLSEW